MAVVVVNWRGGLGVGGGINPAVLPAASQPASTWILFIQTVSHRWKPEGRNTGSNDDGGGGGN